MKKRLSGFVDLILDNKHRTMTDEDQFSKSNFLSSYWYGVHLEEGMVNVSFIYNLS